MNLVIDVGNSLLKIALFQKSHLVVKYDFSKSDKIDIDKIFKNYSIINSIVSNVSQISPEILTYLEKQTNLVLLNNKLKFPFKNLYKTKETLGQDRLGLISVLIFQTKTFLLLMLDRV